MVSSWDFTKEKSWVYWDFMGFHGDENGDFTNENCDLLRFKQQKRDIYSGYLWEYHVYIIINMKTRYGHMA